VALRTAGTMQNVVGAVKGYRNCMKLAMRSKVHWAHAGESTCTRAWPAMRTLSWSELPRADADVDSLCAC